MRILISGGGGFVGGALLRRWRDEGVAVTRLWRGAAPAGEHAIAWDPLEGVADPAALEGFDACVHLAGASIVGKRWTVARKRLLQDSRVTATERLVEQLGALESPPKTFLCASAVGYYGDRGDTRLDETSPPGSGFLADLCQRWEAAATRLDSVSRVVQLRIGMVLNPRGGALAAMLPLFKLGLGGPLGSGMHYVSWVGLDGLRAAVSHILARQDLRGPVNLVAPEPLTNKEFTKILGRVLRRPAMLPAPRPALRLVLGEMAGELLFSSARVYPKRLLDTGFVFQHGGLEATLRHELASAPSKRAEH